MLTVSGLAPGGYAMQGNSAFLRLNQQNPGAALPSYAKRALSLSR